MRRKRVLAAPQKAVHRIVMVHTIGRLAGLWRILGTDATLEGLPPLVENVDFIDHRSAAALVGVKRRYALYREMGQPESPTFHPDQQ